MPLNEEQKNLLLQDFLYVMRDHNTGFNPAWEYLAKSRMQQNWYAFEYFHKRFLYKALWETSHKLFDTVLSVGLGTALGAVTGPGAIPVFVGGITYSLFGLTIGTATPAAITKGQRAYLLHKFRKQNDEVVVVPVEYNDQWSLLFCSGYYYWPGYFKKGLDVSRWNDILSTRALRVFHELKNFIYFKPPKSGIRVNTGEFYFPYLNITEANKDHFDEETEITKFNILWGTTAFWPMLDYLYFCESFYKELMRISVDSRNFFYTSRYYFLKKDFYVNKFFNSILPKYELLLTEDIGIVSGSNILNKYFKRLSQHTREGVPSHDVIRSIQKYQDIMYLIINVFTTQFKGLEADALVDVLSLVRNLFSGYFHAPQSEQTGEVFTRNRIQLEKLKANHLSFDSIVNDQNLTEFERENLLRICSAERRILLSGKLDLPENSSEKIKETLNEVGESAIEWFHLIYDNLGRIFGLEESLGTLTNRPTDSIEVTILMAGIESGVNLLDIITHQLAMPIIRNSSLVQGAQGMTPQQLRNALDAMSNVMKVLSKVVNIAGIGLGTADMIHKFIAHESFFAYLPSRLLQTGSELFIGPSVFTVIAGIAFQAAKTHSYEKQDEACIELVDSLIEVYELPNIEERLRSTSRRPPTVPTSGSPLRALHESSASPIPEANPSPLSLLLASQEIPPTPQSPGTVIKRGYFDLSNLLSNEIENAQIFENSAKKFSKSKLVLPGVHSSLDGSRSSYVQYFNTPKRILHFYGYCTDESPKKARGDIGSYCSLVGNHLVQYSAIMPFVYRSFFIRWMRELQILRLDNPDPRICERLVEEKSRIFLATIKKEIKRLPATDPAKNILGTLGSLPLNINVKMLGVMGIAWSKLSKISYFLLKLEENLLQFKKIKNPTKQFIAGKTILTIMKDFSDALVSEYNAIPGRLRIMGHEEYSMHATHLDEMPSYFKHHAIYMRLLHLSGLKLFVPWYVKYVDLLKQNLSTIRTPNITPAILANAEVQIYNFDFIVDGFNHPSEEKSKDNLFTFKLNQSDALLYDSICGVNGYGVQKLELFIEKCIENIDSFDPFFGIELPAVVPDPTYEDYSFLNLGFRFKKDPTQFTEDEKVILYNHFGRVLRHQFNDAPSPETLLTQRTELENICAGRPDSTRPIGDDISVFFNKYFAYILGIMKLNKFTYYARVYQFVQESLDFQFLNMVKDNVENFIDINSPAYHELFSLFLDDQILLRNQLTSMQMSSQSISIAHAPIPPLPQVPSIGSNPPLSTLPGLPSTPRNSGVGSPTGSTPSPLGSIRSFLTRGRSNSQGSAVARSASPLGSAGPASPLSPLSSAGPASPLSPLSSAGPASPLSPLGSAGPASPLSLLGSAGPASPLGSAGPASPLGSAGPVSPQALGSGIVTITPGTPQNNDLHPDALMLFYMQLQLEQRKYAYKNAANTSQWADCNFCRKHVPTQTLIPYSSDVRVCFYCNNQV